LKVAYNKNVLESYLISTFFLSWKAAYDFYIDGE